MDISPSRGATALHVLVTVTHVRLIYIQIRLRLVHVYLSYIKKNSQGFSTLTVYPAAIHNHCNPWFLSEAKKWRIPWR